MASPSHPVGIIELDVDPHLKAVSDEDVGQTLRRLRSIKAMPANSSCLSFPCLSSTITSVGPQNAKQPAQAVATLTADLQQMRLDLESELAALLDQLLWSDSPCRPAQRGIQP